MGNIEKCIICESEKCKRVILEKNNVIVTKWRYECKYCGKYDVNDDENLIDVARKRILWEGSEFDKHLLENIKKNLYKLQSYIREMNDEYNEIPYLTEGKIKTIINLPDKTIQEKVAEHKEGGISRAEYAKMMSGNELAIETEKDSGVKKNI
jgi:hypothetical protein